MFYKKNSNKKSLLEWYAFRGPNGRYVYDESDSDYIYDEIGQAILQLCAKPEYKYGIKPDENKDHVYHCSDEYVNFSIVLMDYGDEYGPYIEDLKVHFYVPDTEHDILQTVVNFNKALSDMKFKK